MDISTEKEFREWVKSCNWGYLRKYGEKNENKEELWIETYITPSGIEVDVFLKRIKQNNEVQILRLRPWVWDGG